MEEAQSVERYGKEGGQAFFCINGEEAKVPVTTVLEVPEKTKKLYWNFPTTLDLEQLSNGEVFQYNKRKKEWVPVGQQGGRGKRRLAQVHAAERKLKQAKVQATDEEEKEANKKRKKKTPAGKKNKNKKAQKISTENPETETNEELLVVDEEVNQAREERDAKEEAEKKGTEEAERESQRIAKENEAAEKADQEAKERADRNITLEKELRKPEGEEVKADEKKKKGVEGKEETSTEEESEKKTGQKGEEAKPTAEEEEKPTAEEEGKPSQDSLVQQLPKGDKDLERNDDPDQSLAETGEEEVNNSKLPPVKAGFVRVPSTRAYEFENDAKQLDGLEFVFVTVSGIERSGVLLDNQVIASLGSTWGNGEVQGSFIAKKGARLIVAEPMPEGEEVVLVSPVVLPGRGAQKGTWEHYALVLRSVSGEVKHQLQLLTWTAIDLAATPALSPSALTAEEYQAKVSPYLMNVKPSTPKGQKALVAVFKPLPRLRMQDGVLVEVVPKMVGGVVVEVEAKKRPQRSCRQRSKQVIDGETDEFDLTEDAAQEKAKKEKKKRKKEKHKKEKSGAPTSKTPLGAFPSASLQNSNPQSRGDDSNSKVEQLLEKQFSLLQNLIAKNQQSTSAGLIASGGSGTPAGSQVNNVSSNKSFSNQQLEQQQGVGQPVFGSQTINNMANVNNNNVNQFSGGYGGQQYLEANQFAQPTRPPYYPLNQHQAQFPRVYDPLMQYHSIVASQDAERARADVRNTFIAQVYGQGLGRYY